MILSNMMIFIEYQCVLCDIYVGQRLPHFFDSHWRATGLCALTVVCLISILPRLHVLFLKKFYASSAGVKMKGSRENNVEHALWLQQQTLILISHSLSLIHSWSEMFDYFTLPVSAAILSLSLGIKFNKIIIKRMFVGSATHKWNHTWHMAPNLQMFLTS